MLADIELPGANDSSNDDSSECSDDNDENADQNQHSNDVIQIAAYQRKKRQKKGFPAHLPRREVIIKALDRICACGKTKKLICYEITELLNHIPEVFEVIEQKREILGCSYGCENTITIAPNPPRMLPKTSITDSVVVHTIISKLYDRQPLYHLEKVFKERFDLDLSRNKLARWFVESFKALQPLVNLMKDEIIDYDIASCDATGIQVLDEPGRLTTQKSYWFCMRGGPPDKRVVRYDYNSTQHKPFLVNWFDEFNGYLHVDAQNIFDAFNTTWCKARLLQCTCQA